MPNKYSPFIGLFFLTLFFAGCTDKYAYKNVDVSNLKSDIKIERFEQDFLELSSSNFSEKETLLKQKYGEFYEDYVKRIMLFENAKDSSDLSVPIVEFLTNKAIKGLYDSVNYYYPNTQKIKQDLDEANKYLQYYFPDKKISRVYTMISEFSYGAMTYNDSTLIVGLDMYLGPQYPFYQNFEIPAYMSRKLKEEYIVPNCMEVYYNLYFNKENENVTKPLIETMVNEGKRYYFLECMLPKLHDSLIIGYTGTQTAWSQKSEKQIWQYFNEKDLLYSTNFMEQKRYTTDGPSTTGMPSEAPGKMGSWVGWQIVRKFMKEANGTVSLHDLLTKVDVKKIIISAKYKP